jgi:hypothetical protein
MECVPGVKRLRFSWKSLILIPNARLKTVRRLLNQAFTSVESGDLDFQHCPESPLVSQQAEKDAAC